MGLMRFLLAMSVVSGHLYFLTKTDVLIPGDLAVEVFYSISGFYMSLILCGKYRDRTTTFYLNRFLRLYPVYFVVSIATWAWLFSRWVYLGGFPPAYWINAYQQMSWWQVGLLATSNWTMVGLDVMSLFSFSPDKGFLFFEYPAENLLVGGFRTIAQGWSIGTEIWFYLIVPFLVTLRSRWIFLIALLSLVLKIAMMKFGFQIPAYYFFPAQLVFFMVGILLHRVYAAGLIGKLDRRISYAVLTVVVILFLWCNKFPQTIAPYVIYATFIPAIPILFSLTRNNRFDVELGNLSYPVYLVHGLILDSAPGVVRHTIGELNNSVLVMIVVSIILLASIFLYVAIEKPINEIRQRRAGGVLPPKGYSSSRMTAISMKR